MKRKRETKRQIQTQRDRQRDRDRDRETEANWPSMVKSLNDQFILSFICSREQFPIISFYVQTRDLVTIKYFKCLIFQIFSHLPHCGLPFYT